MEAAFQGAPDPPAPCGATHHPAAAQRTGTRRGAYIPSWAPAAGGGGRRLGDHTGGRVNLSTKLYVTRDMDVPTKI